jgi:predicted TIM-barrel fold metal-dependent hydrolase
MTDDELMRQTLDVLERRNILAVTSGLPDFVDKWKAAGKDRIIPALMFWMSPEAPTVDTVRQWLETKRFAVFGEVTNQLVGVSPSDPQFDAYLAVAEELDVPVAIHMAAFPPGAPYMGLSAFKASFGSPFLLEDALVRHPKLRVYVMHAGAPLLEEMIAVMSVHPQVHVDVGAIDWRWPREQFHHYLRGLVDAGFGKRIMFGSDQTIWPDAIELAIDSIEQAPFLSEEQKRDILYNNAARFLRLEGTF